MLRTSLVPMVFRILTLAVLCGPAPSLAQSRPEEITFHQITLTADGVIGIDTTGQAWQYDFEKATFEKTTVPSGGTAGVPGERSQEAAELPVEVRCSEELRLEPFVRGNIVVGVDQFVDGSIHALNKVTVRGWVKGNIQSENGPVIVAEGGQVDGDIRSPEITIRRGGTLLGRQVITDRIRIPKELTDSFETVGLWVVFGLTLFFLLSTFLYFTLMPRQVDNFSHCVSRYPAKSAAVGLLFVFGLPVLVLLLAITLVGALLIPFVPFAYVFAISLGVVTTSRLLGIRILRAAPGREYQPMVATAIGLVAIMAMWTLVALLMGSSSSVAFGFGVATLVIAIIISIFPICAGIGAAVLTRFGFRPHISLRDRLAAEQAAVPAPAPPPIRRTTPFDVSGQPPTPPVPPPPPQPPSIPDPPSPDRP